MTRRKFVLGLVGSGLLTLVSAIGQRADAAPCSTAYVAGNVFASVGSSTVNVYTPTGTSVCSLNDASGATFTTGSGFDSSGNFYVTNFSSGTVSKFDNSGNLVNSAFMSSNNTPESIDIQSSGFYAGSSLVGGPGGALINQYDTSTGALVHSYSVLGGNGTGGTDWVDTYNSVTGQVIYDGEGTAIRSAILNPDGTVTQLSDFSSAATESSLHGIFALRTIPSGAFAGDVLVADSVDAVLLNSSGDIIFTYSLPGNGGGDFALNLDPNGVDFWTGDFVTGRIWEVNIATGVIDNMFDTSESSLYGISVYGELQQGGAPSKVPEPASLALFGAALLELSILRWRKAA